MLSSGVSVDINIDGAVVSYPTATFTAEVALAALRLQYTYHLALYHNFDLGGIRYSQFPLYGTAESAAEEEAAAALASSDIEKKFRSHSNERDNGEGEGDREGTRFYFLPFSSEAMSCVRKRVRVVVRVALTQNLTL